MVEICWLGQGGFLIATEKTRVVIDPYLSDCVFKKQQLARLHQFPVALDELKPDLLLISHDHMDHLDPEGIPQILEMYPECRYLSSAGAYKHLAELGAAERFSTLLAPGNKFQYNDFTVSWLPAFHSDPAACGFLIEVENKRIIITGDTIFESGLFVPELNNADLLLICINGKLGNMNDVEALEYVKRTRPETALPMHIGLFAENTADPADFISGCAALGVKSFAMTPGKFFVLSRI